MRIRRAGNTFGFNTRINGFGKRGILHKSARLAGVVIQPLPLAGYLDEADQVIIQDEHVEVLDLDDRPDLVVIQVYITSAKRAYQLAGQVQQLAAENVKRVVRRVRVDWSKEDAQHPYLIRDTDHFKAVVAGPVVAQTMFGDEHPEPVTRLGATARVAIPCDQAITTIELDVGTPRTDIHEDNEKRLDAVLPSLLAIPQMIRS